MFVPECTRPDCCDLGEFVVKCNVCGLFCGLSTRKTFVSAVLTIKSSVMKSDTERKTIINWSQQKIDRHLNWVKSNVSSLLFHLVSLCACVHMNTQRNLIAKKSRLHSPRIRFDGIHGNSFLSLNCCSFYFTFINVPIPSPTLCVRLTSDGAD